MFNVPLGILESSEFKQWSVPTAVGDMLLCYTDSLIEARCGDELLGTAGLLALVQELDAAEPSTLVPRLLETLETRCTAADDDATVLLVRTNDLIPREVRQARPWAPLRLLRALAGSVRPGGESMPWPELSVANIGGALVPALGRWRRTRR